MYKTDKAISTLELKKLMISIIDTRLNIYIRCRLIGEMWQQNFMRILRVTDKGVLLNDEVKNRIISIQYLSHIMQFELDGPFQTFQPHFHYEVTTEDITAG